MKLTEIIEKYNSYEKSKYPAENWVRLGQFLEPEISTILGLESKKDSDNQYYIDKINELKKANRILMFQREQMIRDIVNTCDKAIKNKNCTAKDVISAIDKLCIELLEKNPSF